MKLNTKTCIAFQQASYPRTTQSVTFDFPCWRCAPRMERMERDRETTEYREENEEIDEKEHDDRDHGNGKGKERAK